MEVHQRKDVERKVVCSCIFRLLVATWTHHARFAFSVEIAEKEEVRNIKQIRLFRIFFPFAKIRSLKAKRRKQKVRKNKIFSAGNSNIVETKQN